MTNKMIESIPALIKAIDTEIKEEERLGADDVVAGLEIAKEKINELKAGIVENKRLLPFDTNNRPSTVDRCARCGHIFLHHNLACIHANCDCSEFMIEVIEISKLLGTEGLKS